MTTGIATDFHHHYYDYGYSEWQCVECDTATDYCTAEHFGKVNTTEGAVMANRFPEGV